MIQTEIAMDKTGLIPSSEKLSWLGSLSEIESIPSDAQMLTRGAVIGNIYEIYNLGALYFLKFENNFFRIWT